MIIPLSKSATQVEAVLPSAVAKVLRADDLLRTLAMRNNFGLPAGLSQKLATSLAASFEEEDTDAKPACFDASCEEDPCSGCPLFG